MSDCFRDYFRTSHLADLAFLRDSVGTNKQQIRILLEDYIIGELQQRTRSLGKGVLSVTICNAKNQGEQDQKCWRGIGRTSEALAGRDIEVQLAEQRVPESARGLISWTRHRGMYCGAGQNA